MLYMCCIYAVSQRVLGYYNWHSSPLKAHTTHSKADYYTPVWFPWLILLPSWLSLCSFDITPT